MSKILHPNSSFLVILLLCFVNQSCNYKIEKGNFRKNVAVDKSLIETVSFNQIKREVFEAKCISCHGNSGGVNLETYSTSVQYLNEIKGSVFNKQSMPKSPYPRLNKRESELLMAWIMAGGPDRSLRTVTTGEDGGEEPPLPSVDATFDSIQQNILAKKCIVCHSVDGDAEDLPLVTKDDLVNSSFENLVIPGNPQDSRLMQVLDQYSKRFMPPRRSGISPVTEEEKNAIQIWIQNGAN